MRIHRMRYSAYLGPPGLGCTLSSSSCAGVLLGVLVVLTVLGFILNT